jgi:hypothetical protein
MSALVTHFYFYSKNLSRFLNKSIELKRDIVIYYRQPKEMGGNKA